MASSIIGVLSLIYERFTDHGATMRSNPVVRSVKVAVSPRCYRTRDCVECYVDVELASGQGVTWWLEFRFDHGSWIIESSVRHNTGQGEEELIELATRYAVEDEELVKELDGASAALVATAKQLDLASL